MITPITEERLNALTSFRRETEGQYGEHPGNILISRNSRGQYNFYKHTTIGAKTVYIKTLSSMEDLANLYKAIRDKDLT